MNEVLKAIKERRATRGFTDEKLTDEAVKTIVQAGFDAPSAMNAQDYYFVVVEKQELIDELNLAARDRLPESAKERMTGRNNGDPNFSIFYFAKTVILTFKASESPYSTVDCGIASQNMVLAAQSLGYNSCYIGLCAMAFEDKSFYEKLGVPQGYEFATALTLGKGSMEMPDVEKDFTKVNYIK
ncbi:MAG: nitroreductase family protein [Lachnospirales bacterium]